MQIVSVLQLRHVLSRSLVSLLALLSLCLPVGIAQAAVSPANAVWIFNADTLATNPERIFELRIHITQAAYDRLSLIQMPNDPLGDIYESASVELVCGEVDQARCGGATSKTWTGAGFRMKGQMGSFRPMSGKAGFKVKFPKTNLFFGLKKLTLNNGVQDGARVNQTLAYDLFRAAGIAAPRTGYTLVKVIVAKNDGSFETLDYGLYINVETPDDLFLIDRFGSYQHLYEASYGADIFPGSEPVDPFVDGHFELDEGSATNFTDLTTLINLNTQGGPGSAHFANGTDAWFAAIKTKTDMVEMTQMWAIEGYLGHWDGYPTQNNYFLYSDPSGRFSMLPWGTDDILKRRLNMAMCVGVMCYRCHDVAECRGMYDQGLDNASALATSLGLAAKAAALHAVLLPHIAADPRKEDTVEDTIAAKDSVVNFLNVRESDIVDYHNCVPDTDGDGINDCVDEFPIHDAAAVDTDGDGKPNDLLYDCGSQCYGLVLDNDDDNDGVPDAFDASPLVRASLSTNGIFKGAIIRERVNRH